MDFTVFYSWQSDLENKFNRSFIQDALEKAARSISNSEHFSLDAVVDRDTYGIPGSPSIVESITGKIAKSDVFVCDVSIINTASDKRQTPNPNVLYELGFASAILGWDRIIMIQNTAFGGPDKLPFDLRGRRILQYYFDSSFENKADEKQKLKQKLIDTLNDAFYYYSSNSLLSPKEKVIWWGTWKIDSRVSVRGGQLNISRVSSDAFFFDIFIFDGARSGEVHGKAQILTPHSAYARIRTAEGKHCEIVFRRRLESDGWCIEVEEGPNCLDFHGLSVTFSGTYKHAYELVVNRGFLDELDMNEIERLIGKLLPNFLSNFQQFGSSIENDLTIIHAGVKGMYTIMESIVVKDNRGNIWCAFLDPNAELVRCFTNATVGINSAPKAVQDWLSKFSGRQMVINDIVQEQSFLAVEETPIQSHNAPSTPSGKEFTSYKRTLGRDRKQSK